MADVNPNQDLRFKEIMRRLIPGGYCLVFLQIVHGLHGGCVDDTFAKIFCVKIGLSNGIVYSMIVVIAYTIGFLNNTIASKWERWLYERGLVRRPSRMVLTKNSKYRMKDSELVVLKSGVTVFGKNVCQEQAAQILSIAKSEIKRKDNLVEEMFHQSIMARNLLCIHVITAITAIFMKEIRFDVTFILQFTIISFVVGFLFWKEWRRKNMIYVRNIFEEYLRN